MNETTNPTSVITSEYRKQLGLTYRSFAEALVEHLVNTNISHASIMNWEKGCTDPNTDFLLICLVVHTDWRADWAVDCLCAKLPEVFSPEIDHQMIVLTNRVVAQQR